MKVKITDQQLKAITNIKYLAYFDFDGTLIKSVPEEEGKKRWEQVKNMQYPHKGWWSKPESLDMDVFEIAPNSSVVKDYKERYNDSNTLCFLLTNRIPDLEPTIKEILNSHGIVMDGYYFREKNRDKAKIIKEEIQIYPNVEMIEIWDDREKQISKFRELKNELKNIQFNIYAVNN